MYRFMALNELIQCRLAKNRLISLLKLQTLCRSWVTETNNVVTDNSSGIGVRVSCPDLWRPASSCLELDCGDRGQNRPLGGFKPDISV